MLRVSLHGLRVAYSIDELPLDPLAGFFDRFPTDSGTAPPDLVIELRRARGPIDLGLERGGYTPFFFHGIVQYYRGPSGLLATNGESCALISADARTISIDLTVSPDGRLHVTTEGLVHTALLWVLRQHRFFDLHAAAVAGDDGRPILIVGDSGAGKTTLMLALVEAGLSYLGDDRTLLRCEGEGRAPIVYSYPRELHVGPPTLRAFASLQRFAGPQSDIEAKHSVDAGLAYPGRHHLGGAPPSLLLFPRIGEGETTVVNELPQAEAFGQLLAASAILAVEGMPYRDENLAVLFDLVSTIRCFEVVSGRDALRNPEAVADRLIPLVRLQAA